MNECQEVERKLSGLIYELHDKRIENSVLRRKYQECLMKVQDLELDLEREKKKSVETKIQLEVAIKASERCETKRITLREQVAAQLISSEAVQAERDHLHEQNRHLQSEINEIRRELEAYKNQVRDLSASVDNFRESFNRNNQHLEATNKQVELLEKEGDKVKSLLDKTRILCHKALTRVSTQSSLLRETIEERDHIKQQHYQLQGQYDVEINSRSKDEINESMKQMEFCIDQWKVMEEGYIKKLDVKEEELKRLESEMSSFLELYKSLQNQHSQLKQIFFEAEEELKKEKIQPKISSSDAASDTSDIFVSENILSVTQQLIKQSEQTQNL